MELFGPLGRLKDAIERYRLVLDVAIGAELGVDRDQVVDAADLDAMAGVIDHGPVGGLDLVLEGVKGGEKFFACDVVFHENGLEADLSERGGDRLRIALRVWKGRDLAVVGVADDQGDAVADRRDQRGGFRLRSFDDGFRPRFDLRLDAGLELRFRLRLVLSFLLCVGLRPRARIGRGRCLDAGPFGIRGKFCARLDLGLDPRFSAAAAFSASALASASASALARASEASATAAPAATFAVVASLAASAASRARAIFCAGFANPASASPGKAMAF